MAAESYAYNFFNENLTAESAKNNPKVFKTLWLSSQFEADELESRLKENPKEFPELGRGHIDIAADGSNLNGSLVVGSIVDLNVWMEKHPKVAAQVREGFGQGGVDLVSGGPPCQSFSMAGLREKNSDKNSLPWEFAKFAKAVQPKLVVLENVTGILRPFTEHGKNYYAWFELAKAFAQVGYVPLCLHVNAKLAGVPQNRPRFILLGVRRDFLDLLKPTFNEAEATLFAQPTTFYERAKTGKDVPMDELQFRDVVRSADLKLFQDSFLQPLVASAERHVSVRDAIDDLREETTIGSKYANELRKTFSSVLPKRNISNHELRTNSPLVQRRFRLYQVLQKVDTSIRKSVLAVLQGHSDELPDESWKALAPHEYIVESGRRVKFKAKNDFLAFLDRHPTKKQTQKALVADQPAPAALSIPDDACHYDDNVQRTLSVREMARIQSFPDNFEFRSKVTTGGKMRSFQVPQYTQVGNAVPPLLARALGIATSDLLSRLSKPQRTRASKAASAKSNTRARAKEKLNQLEIGSA